MTRKRGNDNDFDDAAIAADVRSPDRSLTTAVRRSPDIALVLAVTVAADLFALAPVVRDTPLRIVFAFLLVLWAPGYAVIAALFPPAAEGDAAALDEFERAALSIAASALLAGISGVALSVLSVGVRPGPLAGALTAITVAASAVALARRTTAGTGRVTIPMPSAPTTDRLTVAFVALAVVAVAAAGFAVAAPPDPYTALSVTSDADGAALTDEARTVAPGAGADLTVAVRNREYETASYTVVVVARPAGATALDNASGVESGPDDGTAVSTELHRFSGTVAPGETWRRSHTVSPPFPDDRTRVEYLLYRDADAPPAEPTIANADEAVHVWFRASDASEMEEMEAYTDYSPPF